MLQTLLFERVDEMERWKDRKWQWRKGRTKEHGAAVFRGKMSAFFFALLLRRLVGCPKMSVDCQQQRSVVPRQADEKFVP